MLESAELGDICEWIRTRPMIHLDEARQHVLVHAGLPPQWDAPTCSARAAEVESVLRGPAVEQFLAQMYGNEPATWSDDLSGHPRLRLITNYFTRLRFCRQDGTIELESKETEAPEGYAPWFSFPRPDDYTVVFGHWAALEGHTGSRHAIALDTGCVWGRTMTALRIDDGRWFSVPSRMPDAIG
ncbi:MAG: symmetrical bis(5'-nucleosyl)-tetraphosphatase [Gammaproteobacteria bacterium]|nr:symmetrical bis(5'-nucleosyl)-tetraphosphatase [Gammaproteobacteria bacterium]